MLRDRLDVGPLAVAHDDAAPFARIEVDAVRARRHGEDELQVRRHLRRERDGVEPGRVGDQDRRVADAGVQLGGCDLLVDGLGVGGGELEVRHGVELRLEQDDVVVRG